MRKEVKILVLIAGLVIAAAAVATFLYRDSTGRERVGANRSGGIPPEILVRPDSPSRGAADAPVTIVEFLDPECEACAAFAPSVKKLLAEYEGRARLVVRYMPLHPNSLRAATLTEAAGEQGKYWEMQELLFRRQSEWGERHGPPTGAPPADVPALFEKYALELGLDPAQIDAAARADRYRAKLERDLADGRSLGVRQTPTIFVNGRKLARLSESDLRALVDDELKAAAR